MARRLLLCKVNVLAGRPAFDDLAAAAAKLGLPWHVALERLECEVKAAAEQRALELIEEWGAEIASGAAAAERPRNDGLSKGSCNHSPIDETATG